MLRENSGRRLARRGEVVAGIGAKRGNIRIEIAEGSGGIERSRADLDLAALGRVPDKKGTSFQEFELFSASDFLSRCSPSLGGKTAEETNRLEPGLLHHANCERSCRFRCSAPACRRTRQCASGGTRTHCE